MVKMISDNNDIIQEINEWGTELLHSPNPFYLNL